MKVVNIKMIIIIFILSLISDILMLGSNVLIKELIDNGTNNFQFLITIQLIGILILLIKMNCFLKEYKRLDEKLINNSLNNIYHLNYEYIKKHHIEEIYYRIFDAFNYKEMILSIAFNLISDIILIILSFILIMKYSVIISLFILGVCIPIIIYSYFMFKSTMSIKESIRNSEYEFIDYYKNSFNNLSEIYINKNEKYYIKSVELLKILEGKKYIGTKLTNKRNLIYSLFQSLITMGLIFFYSINAFEGFTIGKLILMINSSNLLISPILSVCEQLNEIANISLIKNRLIDLKNNLNN